MNWDMHWLSTAFDGFVGFLPNLVAGLFVLLLGYVIARLLAGATRSVLRRIDFDGFMARVGLAGRGGDDATRPASYWAGTAVLTVILAATLMQVARIWNMTFVAVGFARLLAYVPHVIGAVLIFVGAMFLAGWVRDRLLSSTLMSSGPTGQEARMLPFVVRGVIIAIGGFMALRELQIAPEIVNLAFSLTLGAVALAAALAFGLGGRDVARHIAQSWYERRSGGASRRPFADFGATRPG